WLDAFAPGTVIAAPLRSESSDELLATRLVHRGDHFDLEHFEPVSFVPARRREQLPAASRPEPVRLPVIDGRSSAQ
ncbi:MAG: hypothetical protein KC431_30185, partial [Myxococcales bacterium]|nr:hypothetical protein [Myxococcales bacterium]